MYESQVTFTLDTVCPWTFLAKKRLDQALAQVRASPSAANITFNLVFESYQLSPDFADTDDKQSWYLHNMHLDNPDAQAVYQAHMASLFEPLGIRLDFSGPTGNSLRAHVLLQDVQERHHSNSTDDGADAVTNRLVDALFRAYFCEARHPAEEATLREACGLAGLEGGETDELVAKALGDEGAARATREKIRRVGMDVDAVPVVKVEGRRRDLTLTGAKEVADYVKALETVIKEST